MKDSLRKDLNMEKVFISIIPEIFMKDSIKMI